MIDDEAHIAGKESRAQKSRPTTIIVLIYYCVVGLREKKVFFYLLAVALVLNALFVIVLQRKV